MFAGIGRLYFATIPTPSEVKSPKNTIAINEPTSNSTPIATPEQSVENAGKTISHAGESTNATERPPNTNKVVVYHHRISSGESIWSIAQKYGVTPQTILAENPSLDAHALQPGRIIKVPNQVGVFRTVTKNQSITSLAKTYRIKVEDILLVNGLTSATEVKSGTRIFLPGQKAIQIALGNQTGTGFRLPVQGRITSRFGYRTHPMGGGARLHTGIDIAASYGATIVAAESGRVIESGWNGLLGKTVVIRHNRGYETIYGHCSFLLVRPGDYVKKGQPIARVGSSGLSTGPHVHFEVHRDGTPVNPLKFIR
ncbi:MAG: peptidoglycan DD-metalloendopeptidase family protein [bacterium]|nr:peptidoglycan DD-metalloendopeptidase family protein [bacterium]